MTIARAMGGGAIASPLVIAGCQLWLDGSDAASITSDVNGVSAWNDKSGNTRHATQSNNSYKPTYTATQNSKGIVTFTATQGLATPAFQCFPNKRGSMFCVYNATSASLSAVNIVTIYPSGGVNFSWVISTTGTKYGWYTGSDFVRATYGSSTFYTESVVRSADQTLTLYRNGAQDTQWTALTNNQPISSTLKIGSAGGGSLIGSIAELIVYDTALPAATRIRIENYLRSKWGTG